MCEYEDSYLNLPSEDEEWPWEEEEEDFHRNDKCKPLTVNQYAGWRLAFIPHLASYVC